MNFNLTFLSSLYDLQPINASPYQHDTVCCWLHSWELWLSMWSGCDLSGNVGCSFSVQTVMAPVSHLLVYYVTRAGEPISDVITFDVKLLQKKVRYHSTMNALYRALRRFCLVIISLSLNSKWSLVTLVVWSIFQTFLALMWFSSTSIA